MNWSYGITTVPQRIQTTLPTTVKSLSRAGFDCPTLFVDGYLPGDYHIEYFYGIAQKKVAVVLHPNIGHLANWMTALVYLYSSDPCADRYVIFEDDLLSVVNLREYLEKTEYPEKTYFNLLTHNQNLILTGCKEGWCQSNQLGRGAVGLMFSRRAVQDLMASRAFVDRPTRWNPKVNQKRGGADGMVLDSLKQQGYLEYVHYPSLLQHVHSQSTLGHAYGPVKGFKGEEYDPLKILAK